MTNPTTQTTRPPREMLGLTLLGTVALVLGWVLFVYYRVPHTGLAL